MRQTFLTVTCDKCGIRETFETLLVSGDGPMVAKTGAAMAWGEHAKVTADRDRLAQENAELRDALHELYDWQNGPPLLARKFFDGWINAMNLARKALAEGRGVPELTHETTKTTAKGETNVSYIYLASPYTHASPAVQEARFQAVCKVAARLMNDGHVVFSPIAHTHPIALAGELPPGWDYWERVDRAMLQHATKLLVLRMDGWLESKGMAAEIAIAGERGIPLEYIDP